MKIADLLLKYSKILDENSQEVVISSRIRLARDFEAYKFPNNCQDSERIQILNNVRDKLKKLKNFNFFLDLSELAELERLALIERRIISKELVANPVGAGAVCADQGMDSIMINEEDHLRIQVLSSGLQLRECWKRINAIDNDIDDGSYAFSDKWGYLTACPSNLGTGMRASVMMHLIGLVLTEKITHLINAVQQIGVAVRGVQGEGSQAKGAIFQISNQQTLGINESEEIRRLENVVQTIIDQENRVRDQLLKEDRSRIYDKIGKIYGQLRCGYVVTSDELFETLSWMRFAVDIGLLGRDVRPGVDRLMTELQPANLAVLYGKNLSSGERDVIRAENLRQFFKNVEEPQFS